MNIKFLFFLLITFNNVISKLVNYKLLFDKHCIKYQCHFNDNEKNIKLDIFKNNYNIIEEHNKKSNFKLELNKFSTLTNDEYKNLLGLNKNLLNNNNDNCDIPKNKFLNNNNLLINNNNLLNINNILNFDNLLNLDNFNWVDKNKITSVKNQLECGSCWAFSTIGSYENWYAINYGELVDFSEQELVDCDNNDNGCNGGLMTNGLTYIKNNGICKYNDYEYNGKKNLLCNNKCTKYPKINGCINVPSNDNVSLKNALLQNAITIAIEANNLYFQHYKSGIIDDETKCGNNVDHGVLLVGYGEENGMKYWLVKNSWGSDWGDKGYVKILRYENNENNNSGVCGILTMPSYPY